MADPVVLKPVDFNPFTTQPPKVALTDAELAADAADARLPSSKDELLREMGRKDLAPGARAILEQHYKTTFGEDPAVNRGAQISGERRRPKPVFPLEGEQKPAVSLKPVDFDPFAGPDTGVTAGDFAKSGAAGALSGTGMIAQGGGELLARGINLVGDKLGFDPQARAVNPLQGWVNDLLNARTPAAKKAEANSQISGELLKPSTWNAGNDPSVAGIALQGVNAIGQFAPNLGVALVTAGASIPAQLAIGATVGGLQALGGGAQDEREAIDKMTHQQLLEGSKLYGELINRGVPQGQAKEAVAEAAALGGGLGNAIPSAGEGAFENFLIGMLTRGKVRIPSLGAGAAGRVATGALGGAAMGGAEEAVEQAGQNVGSNVAIGGDRPVGQDTLQQFVMGMLAEGAAGAGAGALSKAPNAAPAVAAEPVEPAANAAPAPRSAGAVPPVQAPQEPAGGAGATLSPVDQARADAQILKSGGDLAGADETRTKNATLLAVYGENAAVRHVIDAPGQFSAIGDAMLMAAPTVERVRATLQQGQESRDITPDILGAIDELAKIKASGQSVAQVMASGVGHDVSFEGQQLIQFLDENAANPKRIAAFLESYLQEVENATGVPSKVRGRVFDIIQEQHAARKKADEAKALEQVAQADKADDEKLKKVRREVGLIRAETALANLKAKAAKPAGQTAMEAAFERARTLKGKSHEKPRPPSDGAVPARKAANPAPGPAKGAGPAARSAGAVSKSPQADHRGESRPVRSGSDRQGAGEGALNRGAQIADELTKGEGTRENPVIASRPKHINRAAARAAEQPSSAQKAADNYAKGHFKFADTNPLSKLGVISIETAKGRERVAKDGSWSVPSMPAHYGHLSIAEGNDGDKADVTIGDDLNAKHVYVIDQIDPETKRYDETKSFVGFSSQKAAEAVYAKSFTDGQGKARIGAITEMTPAQYVARAQSNGLKDAVAYREPVAPAKLETPAVNEPAAAPAVSEAEPASALQSAAEAMKESAQAIKEMAQAVRDSVAQPAAKPVEESAAERKRAQARQAAANAEERARIETEKRAERDKLVEAQAKELKKLGVIKEDEPAFSRSKAPIFRSELERRITDLKTNAAPAAQWKATIKALPGVKADEIEWSGINDWLDIQPGKVTKDAVLDYLRENGVKVEETVLGGNSATSDYDSLVVNLDSKGYSIIDGEPETPVADGELMAVGVRRRSDGQAFDITYDARMMDEDPHYDPMDLLPADVREIALRLQELGPGMARALPGDARYASYTLPGGENYRELLLTLPSLGTPAKAINEKLIAKYGGLSEAFKAWTPDEKSAFDAAHGATTREQPSFSSSHFDQPNILAHVRFNERTDAEGKKVLFLEEIQSDWAQKGKREGFAQALEEPTKDEERVIRASAAKNQRLSKDVPIRQLMAEMGVIDMRRALADANLDPERAEKLNPYTTRAPAAPFVGKTEAWVSLALKRMIRYAAENGFDKISWTNGEQQVDRYDLSKHIDRLQYLPKEGRLIARKGGGLVFDRLMSPDYLPDHIGKDAAEKLLAQPIKELRLGRGSRGVERADGHELSGLDLKIGGEGMRAFYDKILPNIANDVLKKVGGGRVGDVTVRADTSPVGAADDSLAFRLAAKVEDKLFGKKGNFLKQPGFDITPKMREQVMEGLPMFSRQADNIEQYKLQQKPARSGQPLFWNAHIGLGLARFETNLGHGERTVGYGIYDAKARDSDGNAVKLGTLRVDLDARGKFSALRLIEIRRDFRQNGLGWGETTIASLLAHNGATPMRIIDIQHHTGDDWDALPFWRKMGTRLDNYSTDPDVQIDGTLTLKDYLQARAEKGKFSRDARPQQASENLAPGSQPAGAPAGAQGARPGESTAQQPDAAGAAGGPAGRAGTAGRDEGVGLTPSAVRQAVEPILEKWGNAPEVVVLGSMADAPEAVRSYDEGQRSQGAGGTPEAFYWGGKVYLVAGALKSPAAAQRALFHETLGHVGLRGTFGDKLNPILDRVAFDFKDRVAAKAAEYGFDVKDPDQRRQAAEEVLADLAATRPQHGLVQRLIAAIRQFLRDIGIDLKLSDADLVANYIAPARGFVERGRAAPAGEPVPAFSRAAAALPSSTFASARTLFDNVTRSDRVLNRVISKFNTPFHIAETHPEFKPVYEEAQDYNQDVSRVANETADLAPDLLPRIEGFSDFKKSAPSNDDIATTANALYAGTLWGGGSPLEGRVWSDEELRTGRARDGNITIAAFDPVSEPQIKLYRQALASVGHSLTEHAKSLVWRLAKQKDIRLPQGMSLPQMVAVSDNLAETQIEGKRDRMKGADDETRARAEAEIAELDAFRQSLKDIQAKTEGLIQHGYFPAMRFGQYAVNVQTLGTDGKWKEEFFGRYETQTAANLAKEELQREYPNATSQVTSGVMNNDAHKLFQGLNLDALELFSEHMRDDSGQPISADPIMQEYFRVAVTERSTLKRQIHRKGTPGFSRDVPRALAQFTVSNATSASRNYHAADMLAKVQKIKAGDLQAYATRYVRYLQDQQEESPALRGFLANYYILGSIAFGAVNMTQPILMTAPYLSQHTSWAKAMAQLGRAAKDLVTGRKDLTPDEQAAYARAAKAGIVSPQEIHQIRAESRASMMGDSPLWQKLEAILAERGVKLPGKLLMRKAAFLWGSIYSMTEQFNRGTTFLAAYRVGKEKGEDAYTFAKNAVDATQGVYARSNRPEVSRGAVGATIMTFKQFNISYLELAKRLYDHDKKAFAVLMLTLMALAGAEGLPFAEDVEDLIDTIGQWMGYPTNAKKALRKKFVEMLGPDIADVMLHGASAIQGVPIDVANRMGMHNIIPGSAMLKTSEPDKTRDLLELLGPAASLFQNAGTAVTGLATGKPGDVKGLLPSALQNALKAAEMVDTGTYRDTKGRKVMDVDNVDAFSKLIGFQPAKVARETRLVGQNQQDIALHRVIEDSIASKWAHGTVDKDPGMVADAVKQWKDWNNTNPEMPVAITGAQLARRIKELQMSREQRFIKSAPREIRGDVARDIRQ